MATTEGKPAGQTEEGNQKHPSGQRGLGRLVESSEPEEVREERLDTRGPTDIIEEASEDSFPASDAPGYATGQAEETAVEPGSQADS